jgi:hypothetical protein
MAFTPPLTHILTQNINIYNKNIHGVAINAVDLAAVHIDTVNDRQQVKQLHL